MELCRRFGAPVGAAGCADGRAPSRLHRAAPARQFRRARELPHLSRLARRAERARGRRLRLAGGADPDRLLPVAHRPLRERAHSLLAVAHRSRRHVAPVSPAASARSPRSGWWSCRWKRRFRLAPRRRAGVDLSLGGAGLLLALGSAGLLAAALPPAEQHSALSPRSASSRRRSTPPALRSAPSSSRAPASGCCTPRKTATGCSPAT